MALTTAEYLAQGGTLTNGQIPTQTIVPQTYDTTYPTVPTKVDSSLVNPNPPMPNPVTSPADTTNYAATTAGAIATPFTNKATTASNNIDALISQLSGKEAYSQQQLQATGANDLQSQQDSLAAQIKALQKQSADLQNQANSIPDQAQLDAAKRGIVTAAGQAPLTAAMLRENSIKQRDIASQALTLSSTYDLNAGNLASAQRKAQQAVDLKYKDLETQLNLYSQQLQQYTPFMNAEQQKVAAQQALANDQKKTDLADMKTRQTEAWTAAKDNGQFDIASQILAVDPNSPTARQQLADLQSKVVLKADPKAALEIQNQQLQNQKLQMEIANINDPSITNPIVTDPNSTSILAQTGLSMPAFAYATQGTSALTRMSATQRQQYINEWGNYQKQHGIDGATFMAQYGAMSKTVGANLLRNNQAQVAESELSSTLQNLSDAADNASFSQLRWANVAKLFAGKEVNDPAVTKYGFHLQQLRQEFAMYNAALAGQIDVNGNIRDITQDDYTKAEQIIKDGIAKGGLDGFKNALIASTNKMQTVLNQSVDAQNKQVWKLFGVGDKFQGQGAPSGSGSGNGTDQYASYRSQVKTGEILIQRNGQVGAIPESEFNSKTDTKL